MQLITIQYPEGSRNFSLITKISTIRWGEIGLKLWILRLCFKSYRQIWQVTLGKYQACLASHSPAWFDNFMTSARLLNCASCYQNIAKFWPNKVWWFLSGEYFYSQILKVMMYATIPKFLVDCLYFLLAEILLMVLTVNSIIMTVFSIQIIVIEQYTGRACLIQIGRK